MPRQQAVKYSIYAADFETTVYSGQESTEVWSSAFCPVRTLAQISGKRAIPQACENDVILHTSIDQSYKWLEAFQYDVILYYHNLKFDGSFWLDYLLKNGWTWWKRATKKDVPPLHSIETCISDLGQWYYIILNFPDHKIEMRDSLKLLPMSLKVIGESFKTKHQKLEMDYTTHRHANEEITTQERAYIKNDVLVLMEALEIIFEQGHNKLTIGSCCMQEYKKSIPVMAYKDMFPDLQAIEAPIDTGAKNMDEYIRKAYKGGWCYAKKDRRRKVIKRGCTADVNSLYPSMMSSESGNYYPVGLPHMFAGSIPAFLKTGSTKFYYFVRINCAFALKEGYLPFMQIKDSPYYRHNEMLEDSRPRIGQHKYMEFEEILTGKKITNHITLTLTCTDYELFHEHYNVYDETVLDGCWFYTDIGIFDSYIDKYRKIKMESKGAVRQIAKLFLNNLYGKMASSDNSSYKKPLLGHDGVIKMQEIEEFSKKTVYIPVGAAITSYARRFTITAAQKNYRYFCYADTDSIHCACDPEQLKGVPIDPVRFCCWKIETCWNEGWFVRAKTYIEHVIEEDQQPIEQPYYNVKCAGLPDACKNLFIQSMTQTEEERHHHENIWQSYLFVQAKIGAEVPYDTMETEMFLSKKRTLKDFDSGLMIYGKLTPVRIPGGIVLQKTFFTIK